LSFRSIVALGCQTLTLVESGKNFIEIGKSVIVREVMLNLAAKVDDFSAEEM
jgi:hypothetical protein